MARNTTEEIEQLWEQFHGVVNMTSRELLDWIDTAPTINPTPGPDGPGSGGPPPLGQAVVSLLGKRRTDLTDADLDVMRKVINVVEEETTDVSSQEVANNERRRHRLLNVGHDPLRGT